MGFDFKELLIIVKLMNNNYNGKVLTNEELKILSEAVKREIDLKDGFTKQEKEDLKSLVDVAEEESKRLGK